METVENLSKQLEEIEMLQSIYAGSNEFVTGDRRVIADVQRFVEKYGKTALVLKRITYTINLTLPDNVSNYENMTFSVMVELPNNYPNECPLIFVRSEKLQREDQKRFNDDLEEHLLGSDGGEVCVFESIQWIQENISKYINYELTTKAQTPKKETLNKPKANTFSRLWILSHHIYSKFKRKDMLEWGSDLGLTGFCLPGKPGIICVEGPTEDAEEFWSRVRRMTWKKISCKHREDYKLPSSDGEPESTQEKRRGRCFGKFEEMNFNARGFGSGRDYHMDFGLFQQYLEERGLHDIFKLLLGVEGKSSSMSCKET